MTVGFRGFVSNFDVKYILKCKSYNITRIRHLVDYCRKLIIINYGSVIQISVPSKSKLNGLSYLHFVKKIISKDFNSADVSRKTEVAYPTGATGQCLKNFQTYPVLQKILANTFTHSTNLHIYKNRLNCCFCLYQIVLLLFVEITHKMSMNQKNVGNHFGKHKPKNKKTNKVNLFWTLVKN